MTGHRQILALRSRGMKPGAIFFNDFLPNRKPEQDIEIGDYPAVYVGSDNPDLADVRFVTGCVVHFWSKDPNRAVRWVDALLKVRPRMVVQSGDGEVYVWRP